MYVEALIDAAYQLRTQRYLIEGVQILELPRAEIEAAIGAAFMLD